MAPRKPALVLPPLPMPGVPVYIRLQQLRTERRLSQRELARAAGIRQDTISRLELGYTRLPQRRTMEHLATALGLTEATLRQALGMHGPLYRPAPREVERQPVAASTRAQQVATLFDQLMPEQQQYLEGVLLLWTAGHRQHPAEEGVRACMTITQR